MWPIIGYIGVQGLPCGCVGSARPALRRSWSARPALREFADIRMASLALQWFSY